MSPEPENQLFTAEQVAKRLQIRPSTVLRLAVKGEINGVKLGKSWRFTEQDIADYIESQREKK
jgi:excisionase family DNA binding protein